MVESLACDRYGSVVCSPPLRVVQSRPRPAGRSTWTGSRRRLHGSGSRLLPVCLGDRVLDVPQADELSGRQRAGGPSRPEAATGFPTVPQTARRTTSRSTPAARSSRTEPVITANFKAAIDRDADPSMQSPAMPFFTDIVGVSEVARSRRGGQGQHLIIHLTQQAADFEARVAMPFFCAITVEDAARPAGCTDAAFGRPVLHREPRHRQADRPQAEPVLQGEAPAHVEHDRLHDRQLAAATYLRVSKGRRTTPPAASRLRPTPKRRSSTASTSRSSSSTRSSTNYLALNTRALSPAFSGLVPARALLKAQLRDRPPCDARAGRLPAG